MPDFIGSRTRSKEGPRHVTGRGLYTDDFHFARHAAGDDSAQPARAREDFIR